MKKALFLLVAFALSLPPAWAEDVDVHSLPEHPPLPSARPAESVDARPENAGDSSPMPAEEVECRQRLREMGVAFAEHEPIEEPAGCSARWPLSVSRLPGDVEMRPDAVMTCAMAEATARFVETEAAPLSRAVFGSDLAALDQVSSYVCRARTDGAKLSEHAFANALDWGALELEDGTRIGVQPYSRRFERQRAHFMTSLRNAACGPFKTVLGPGSDSAHADHFHFDLAERRNGGTWCE